MIHFFQILQVVLHCFILNAISLCVGDNMYSFALFNNKKTLLFIDKIRT